eukprot:m.346557 g.346557  ORF g.346557 m.346557 type:complete len:408 (-) comp29544_c0_seq1:22-1245(-)
MRGLGRLEVVSWEEEALKCLKILTERIKTSASKRNTSNSSPCIVVTGANGFVGTFLVHALANKYKDLKVFCMVRRDKDKTKMLESFSFYELSVPSNIVTLDVDITQVHFGLGESTLEELRANTMYIYHCAAHVSGIQPYSQLYDINVGALLNILGFACGCANKPRVVHVSTMGFVPSGLAGCSQEDIPHSHLALSSGYNQSKWVADRVAVLARRNSEIMKNMEITILRVGVVSPAFSNGACNQKDAFINFLLGLIKEGVVSWDDSVNIPKELKATPVDFVANVLSFASDMNLDKTPCVYNLSYTYSVSVQQIVKWLELRNFSIKSIGAREFRMKVREISDSTHPWYPYKAKFLTVVPENSQFEVSNESKLPIYTPESVTWGVKCRDTQMSEEAFDKIMKFLTTHNLL